jgi:hypothetical protein
VLALAAAPQCFQPVGRRDIQGFKPRRRINLQQLSQALLLQIGTESPRRRSSEECLGVLAGKAFDHA